MADIGERLKNSWDALLGREPTRYVEYGYGSGLRPDRPKLSPKNAQSVVASIYNQIAVDVSLVNIQHAKVDKNGRYVDTIDDPLNRCLTRDANRDQSGRQLIQDIVMSMFDEGCIAVVPTVTSVDYNVNSTFDVYELRTGKIVQWYPKHILVEVYNENTGQKVQTIVPKRACAIIENPFYTIMNEANALAKRYINVLNQLDRTNEQNSSGKIDLLVQLPYSTKSKVKKDLAEERRRDLEAQLTNSRYGVGYIDSSEHVIQLNRAVDNNLWSQAKELQQQFFNQLGFSPSIFDGTADEATMLNYHNRTLTPILTRIVEEMTRKWLTPTAITQGQSITFFRDPFKLVPISQIAEIADKFTRNEIMTSNEMRAVVGMKPSNDPKADELRNSNINQSKDDVQSKSQSTSDTPEVSE